MSDSNTKPVPSTDVIPANDADRRDHANISPQGSNKPDGARPNSNFTPEGDNEPVPQIPPSATDPA